MKFFISFLILSLLCSACATSRNLTSKHYLPEWENHVFNFPNPSETSGGYWAAKSAHAVGRGIERVIFFPFGVLANIVANAYYIPTWPVRWFFFGDKRLIVWHPLFHVGEKVVAEPFSEEWNRDLV